MFVSSNAFNGLRSSTSSLNSLGWFGSALLSSLEAKSMRPVGTQSRFTTPLTSLLNELFPPAKLAITVSGLGIAHSFSSGKRNNRILTGVVSIKSTQRVIRQPFSFGTTAATCGFPLTSWLKDYLARLGCGHWAAIPLHWQPFFLPRRLWPLGHSPQL